MKYKELSKKEILIAKLATQLYSSAPRADMIIGTRGTTVEECVEVAKRIIEASRLSGLKPRERSGLKPRERTQRSHTNPFIDIED